MKYTSEKELLEDFSEGKEEACAYIYHRYFARICLFASSFVYESKESEDIAEESFIRLWQSKRNYESIQHLKAALYQTARRLGLNYQASRQRRFNRVDTYIRLQDQNQSNQLQEIVYTETMAELYHALNKLPHKAREIVELTYLEGLSNQEVADLLNINIQTVKNQKLRALSLLRKLLSRDSFHYLMSIVFFSSKI